MNGPSVSVIVVSHSRPESLLWCLSALDGVIYENFEIVVVADPKATAGVRAAYGARVKLVECAEANISKARNLGIAQAAGEVIAFIDDDAAAEPMWLAHLVRAFELREVRAAGGYVIGRNGISYQWTARELDESGRTFALKTVGSEPFVAAPSAGRAVKTEGTNMAVRADVLRSIGGFDEAIAFYLDETDLNWRLAQAGERTALVPLAQVHHAYRASLRRSENRGVKDLTDVGASSLVYLRKTGSEQATRLEEIRAEQRARLEAQKRNGLIADVDAVMKTLEKGFEAGAAREFGQYGVFGSPPVFLKFSPARVQPQVMSGWVWQATRLKAEAAEAARQGSNVSLFLFSPSTFFHHVRFTNDGVWTQKGGLFGRSVREAPLVQFFTKRSRLSAEIRRVEAIRGLETTQLD